MKLATLKDGGRDGTLVVVSRDHQRYVEATSINRTLQGALDDWTKCEPALKTLAADLEANPKLGRPLDVSKLHAPLPRAYEWVDGSAYVNHIMLVRKSRGAEIPPTLKTDPLVYQGGSGVFLGPRDPIFLADQSWGCDFESEVAVILGDVPQGTKSRDAAKHVRLLMLVNDVSLRNLIPAELAKGFGFFNSKPATGFSPFAVTPDELGDAWREGRVHLPLKTTFNGQLFGDPNAGPEMLFSFYDLIEHIAKTRAFTAGTILGSGTVSNEDRARGSSCLLEKRMIEQIDSGAPKSRFMIPGDTVEIEMMNPKGQSIFGAIAQKVVGP